MASGKTPQQRQDAKNSITLQISPHSAFESIDSGPGFAARPAPEAFDIIRDLDSRHPRQAAGRTSRVLRNARPRNHSKDSRLECEFRAFSRAGFILSTIRKISLGEPNHPRTGQVFREQRCAYE